MIAPNSVQEVLETAKVEEVVRDFVNLKRRGANYLGLCPFHKEKTPSFNVNPARNIYKCFGCGKAGDPVRFLMEHEQMTFPEAIRYLAGKYGIKLEEEEVTDEVREKLQKQESLYLVNDFALQFFKEQLHDTDLGKSVGLSYFRGRGFKDDVMEKFGLGFAPPGPTAFTEKATAVGYNKDLLVKLGLTRQDGRDFFRDRVMFTIHNLSGKVIAFAGRILKKDVKAPKYINSPETEVYVKNKILYGAYQAKRAIRQLDETILVEGYTDVISLHQAGIENVVASSGTSLTAGQIQLLKRFSQNVKILYDGDAAGIRAALRGLDLILEADLNVRVVILPEGEDPDSYLQSVGATAFKQYLDDTAKDFIMLKADLLLKEAGNDPIKRTELVKDMVSSIAKVPDPIKRSFYIKECARLMEVEEQLLVAESNRMIGREIKLREQKAQREAQRSGDAAPFPTEAPPPAGEADYMPPPQAPAAPKLVGDEYQEKELARILVTGGEQLFDKSEGLTVAQFIIQNTQDVLDYFDNPLYRKVLVAATQQFARQEPITTTFFLQHPDPELQALAMSLLQDPYVYSDNWAAKWDIYLQTQKSPEDNYYRDSLYTMQVFRLRKIAKQREELQERLRQNNDADDDYLPLLRVKMKIDQLLKDLKKELNWYEDYL